VLHVFRLPRVQDHHDPMLTEYLTVDSVCEWTFSSYCHSELTCAVIWLQIRSNQLH